MFTGNYNSNHVPPFLIPVSFVLHTRARHPLVIRARARTIHILKNLFMATTDRYIIIIIIINTITIIIISRARSPLSTARVTGGRRKSRIASIIRFRIYEYTYVHTISQVYRRRSSSSDIWDAYFFYVKHYINAYSVGDGPIMLYMYRLLYGDEFNTFRNDYNPNASR